MKTNRPYKIIMSRGDDIQIDTDELLDVTRALAGKTPVVVRRGIINPSFYVSIVKDEERWKSFLADIRLEKNKDELMIKGVPQLKNMFDDTVLKLKA